MAGNPELAVDALFAAVDASHRAWEAVAGEIGERLQRGVEHHDLDRLRRRALDADRRLAIEVEMALEAVEEA